jgi:putative hydrolase of the HAD superfamily
VEDATIEIYHGSCLTITLAKRQSFLYRDLIMMLDHINTWLFDLDNTLYPAQCDLFGHIDARMTLYLQNLLGCDHDAARKVQKGYFWNYGTTLTGLLAEHQVDPIEFLDFVHDIPMDRLTSDPELARSLNALPGRKLVYTNGDTPYAERVLTALGLGDCFEAVHCIIKSDMIAKPDMRSYEMLVDAQRFDPARAFFADDMARNLKPAKMLGMATLWINNGSEQASDATEFDHVDHHTSALTPWLITLTQKENA